MWYCTIKHECVLHSDAGCTLKSLLFFLGNIIHTDRKGQGRSEGASTSSSNDYFSRRIDTTTTSSHNGVCIGSHQVFSHTVRKHGIIYLKFRVTGVCCSLYQLSLLKGRATPWTSHDIQNMQTPHGKLPGLESTLWPSGCVTAAPLCRPEQRCQK